MTAATIKNAAKKSVARTVAAVFAPLEARQMMAADLTGGASYSAGFYAPGDDLGDVKLQLKQSGGVGMYTGVPVIVSTYLSRDAKFGNGDDIKLASSVFLLGTGAKTQTNAEHSAQLPDDIKAGNYYVVTQVDELGTYPESKEGNNVSFSKGADVRVTTSRLGTGEILGTSKNDVIEVRQTSDNVVVVVNGKAGYFKAYDRNEIVIKCGGGNDLVKTWAADGMNVGLNVDGGAGNDTLYGGDYLDRLDGGAGNDKLYGGRGSDQLVGGGGNDYLEGGEGTDRLDGGTGTDSAKRDTQATFLSIERMIK